MRRFSALLLVLLSILLAGCQSSDAVNDEVGAQRDRTNERIERARDVARDPVGAGKREADRRAAEALRRRGVDGSAP